MTQPERPRILFLFSDTGGGHRSATEAVIEAIGLEFGDRFALEMVDYFKDYTPPPFDRFPAWYPHMVRLPSAWQLGFRLSDGHHRAHLLTSTFWPYVRREARRMVRTHPSELIVSVHPLASAPVLSALGHTNHPPVITLVTDLVTTHALWFHHRTQLCIVATEEARRRALHHGLKPSQVIVAGLPVADRFCQPPTDRMALRQRLGWRQDLPVIVLVGGGDGMGPLFQTASAINAANLPASLVVITGRNKKLKARLEAHSWQIPVHIYGFVREMPDFMQAADILLTKAGPGTISEALNAGLPMVLYSRLPGQEDGNVGYVVHEGAGVWAPEPEQMVKAVQNWLLNPEKHAEAVAACRRLARPQAARQIARILAQQLESLQINASR